MQNKLGALFMRTYTELDNLCALKFGTGTDGVTEYINRLITYRFAPDREVVLPRLVKYRNIKNSVGGEGEFSAEINDVSKSDIHWLEEFMKDVATKKDPLSVYLKKARTYARRRKGLRRFFTVGALLVLLISAAVAAYFLISK